jgi:polysaccharide export outer membrane protein
MIFFRFTVSTLVAFLTVASSAAVAQTASAPARPVAVSTTPANPQTADYSTFKDRNPRYQISRGDIVDLTFPIVPEFNQTVTVQPDGFIALKGVEGVRVAGLTTPQLIEAVQAAYGKILKDPQVTVDLKDFEKPYFIAQGKVGKPGKYELRGETTISQAIGIAGGFQDTAKHSEVMLYRRSGDSWVEVKRFDMKKLLAAKNANLGEDIMVQPGDMIYIPKSATAKIGEWIPHTSVGVPITP